jgi:DNA-directed RNA polymerase subunit M/transcription elongation factor TFIIS
MYLVVNCPNCKGFILANDKNKTRSCPICGYKTNIFNLKVNARVKNYKEAVEIIQNLKKKKGIRRGKKKMFRNLNWK